MSQQSISLYAYYDAKDATERTKTHNSKRCRHNHGKKRKTTKRQNSLQNTTLIKRTN